MYFYFLFKYMFICILTEVTEYSELEGIYKDPKSNSAVNGLCRDGVHNLSIISIML